MTPRILYALCLLTVAAGASIAGGKSGGSSGGGKAVAVKSYVRKDGTVVEAHTRSAPGARTAARTGAPAGPPTAARTSARGGPSGDPADDESDAPDAVAAVAPAVVPAKPAEAKPTPNGTVEPKKVGSVVFPTPAGKLASHVQSYENASGDKRDAAIRKLLNDNEIVLIDVSTPVVMESTFNGWAYCRPTEGPYAKRMIVVREACFARSAPAK